MVSIKRVKMPHPAAQTINCKAVSESIFAFGTKTVHFKARLGSDVRERLPMMNKAYNVQVLRT